MTQAFNLAQLANQVNSSGQLNADTGIYNTVNVANGGTNLSSTPTNGQLLIGNGTGYTLATLTAGTGCAITNGAGSIAIDVTASNPPVDVQVFTPVSGTTWNMPLDGQTMCKIECWGGGGGAGRGSTNYNKGGGGGGSYNSLIVPISYLTDGTTVTVGAAGVGRAGSTGSGTAGGQSAVPLATPFNNQTEVRAYGGGGGLGTSTTGNTSAGGGGGAGLLGNGGTGGTAGRLDGGAGNSANLNRLGSGFLGGGGGGGATNVCGSYTYGYGGDSYYGGGGGCTSGGSPGSSVFGGNGSSNAAGQSPSGGGGVSTAAGANGYNGGDGRVIITCW